jgi:BirA family biotin operon repressor/biotin-[acetyl-CoA-carboxylase] ligase
MVISERELFAILADGQFHSGEELARLMGVSRTAVWKQLKKIGDKGVEVEAVRGRGYRLANPVELLDRDTITKHLNGDTVRQLVRIEVLYQTASTNLLLSERLARDTIHANVIFSEYQTRGRGRGGNHWLSGLGSGLCLSIGWHFDSIPRTLSALSLATGVILTRSLQQAGCGGVQLKWPNDLLYCGAKLGGILIESRGQLAGSVDVIIGIGLNITMPDKLAGIITQRVTDLTAAFGRRPSRNLLAGQIINNMFQLLNEYASRGFDPYINDWRELDYTRGKSVVLQLPDEQVKGRVDDIDENGYLVMSVGGKLMKYSSGDLSLRVLK